MGATGITMHIQAGGTPSTMPKAIAESPRTTRLYARTQDTISPPTFALANREASAPIHVVPNAKPKTAAAQFAETVTTRFAEFVRLIPPNTNPGLANRFLDQQVRSLLEHYLTPKRLISGAFLSPRLAAPLEAEGIVHDPQLGPAIFEAGHFCVLDPAVCTAVISIKASAANIPKFQNRLREIRSACFRDRRPGVVMGVLATSDRAEKQSVVHKSGRTFPAHQTSHPNWCPIFILFSLRAGTCSPFMPAIDALFANLGQLAS